MAACLSPHAARFLVETGRSDPGSFSAQQGVTVYVVLLYLNNMSERPATAILCSLALSYLETAVIGTGKLLQHKMTLAAGGALVAALVCGTAREAKSLTHRTGIDRPNSLPPSPQMKCLLHVSSNTS